MTHATLANLVAYSAQVLIVVAAGALGIAAIRLPMARVRVAYWRLIIAACLALPLFAQPTDGVVFVPAPAVATAAALAVVEIGEIQAEPALSAAAAAGLVLLAGAAIRMLWLGLGVLALARLRRHSHEAVLRDDLETLRNAVAARTSIRWHAAIAQPVAFGWRRPTVLLPYRLAALPADAQRAVVCHELLHIARRDWVWVLGEEAIRCVFWFHPAMWFALTKLQLSREELVDEEVVRMTGVRQPYVRALALFAGEPSAFAAATFIRRRHLIARIRRISEEHTMSRLRIACAFVVLVVGIGAAGLAAVAALPVTTGGATVLRVPEPGSQAPAALDQIDPGRSVAAHAAPQDAVEVADKLSRMRALAEQLRAASDAQRAATQEPRVVHLAGHPASPADSATYRVAPVYPEAAKGHAVEAVVIVRVTVGTAGEVTNVETVRTRLTTERDVTDPAFWAAQPSRLFGQAAEDAVHQWRFEPTGAVRRFEVPVSFEEQHTMVFVPAGRGATATNATPGAVRYSPTEAKPARIRVGGAIRQPVQVTRIAPVYPPAAKDANVQGVVVLELVIGTEGSVQEAIVLRSIPLLDQAALDAAKQWRYQPTLLNGAPVEVIMVATLNFTLPE